MNLKITTTVNTQSTKIGRATAIALVSVMVCTSVARAGMPEEAENLYRSGLEAYEMDNYEAAIELLEKATSIDRGQSEYFHYLGKSYGKLASESNWFRAIELSKKTLVALKQAVELDRGNRRAVIDLIKFYRQAPAFLGGDEAKADALEKQLVSDDLQSGAETASN